MGKCHSCKNGFNGRNGNGYSPCGCAQKTKAVFAKHLSDQEESHFRKLIEQDLKDNPLYSKRNNIVAVPDGEFQIIPPFYKRSSFAFILGLIIGSLLTYFAQVRVCQ